MHFLWLPTLYIRNQDTLDALIPKKAQSPINYIPKYFFTPQNPISFNPLKP